MGNTITWLGFAMKDNQRVPLALIVIFLFFIPLILFSFKPIKFIWNSRNDLKKIAISNSLESEGKQLLKMEKFEEAYEKFKEANSSKYDLYDNTPSHEASFYMREVYFLRGEYERSLKAINKELSFETIQKMLKIKNEIGVHRLVEEKMEYESLIKARRTHSEGPILAHIDYLKKVHALALPPQGYEAIISEDIFSATFRLYEAVGALDSGIVYVDEILDWSCKRLEFKNYCNVKTAAQAESMRAKLSEEHMNWRPYQFIREYLTIREAFEQDKAENFKGCIYSKPGEVCMGHVTKALIQSDYFPW